MRYLFAFAILVFGCSAVAADETLSLLTQENLLSSNKAKWKITELNGSYATDSIPFFDAQEQKHYLDEYDGQTVLVTFWAPWSDVCTKLIPELDNLQKDFRKLPFKVLAVSIDDHGAKLIESFYKGYEIRYLDIYYDYKQRLFGEFKVIGVPTSFLIDHNNKILLKFEGNIQWHDDNLRKLLLSYIPGTPEEPKNSYKPPVVDNSVKLPKIVADQTEDDSENKAIIQEQKIDNNETGKIDASNNSST